VMQGVCKGSDFHDHRVRTLVLYSLSRHVVERPPSGAEDEHILAQLVPQARTKL
jgi:hypothetical protein